ncbi:MAG: fumarate/nitrate reduction transcriptional regulator Fnr [Proteobacteria bacterium]|nr:fumarate/nitrate reduction transcriptional regulator Fnr [Pseudomonadota bacterium]
MTTSDQVISISKLKTSCSTCSLHELCLPRGLNNIDLEKLDHVVKGSRPIQKGDYLFRLNDKFNAFYAVRSGSAKAYILNELGEEQIIGFYFPGEVLGFDAMDQNVHTCFAMALETTTYCSLPYDRIHDICIQIPELQKQMFRLISRELTNENKMLLTINNRTAEERLATFLISLSTRLQKLGYSAIEFNLPMSRQEIANYLGLTIETVSRLLTKFQREQLIQIDKKEIKLTNLSELHSMCEGTRCPSAEGENSVA